MAKVSEHLFVVSALKKFYLAKTKDSSVLQEEEYCDHKKSKEECNKDKSIFHMIDIAKNKFQNNRYFKFSNIQVCKLYYKE
jgi:hypothetical protein